MATAGYVDRWGPVGELLVERPSDPGAEGWRTRFALVGPTLVVTVNPVSDSPSLGWPSDLFGHGDGRLVWTLELDAVGVLSVTRVLGPHDHVDISACCAEMLSDIWSAVPAEAAAPALADLGECVTELAIRAGAMTRHAAQQAASVEGLLMSLAFPLLGAAIERGVLPPYRVPETLLDALRQRSARAASGCLFADKAHRPVTRALAGSMLRWVTPWTDARAPVNLGPALAAATAVDALPPNDLADLLATPADRRAAWTPVDEAGVRRARQLLGNLDRGSVMGVLRSALRCDLGVAGVVEAADAWAFGGRRHLGRVGDIEELRRRCFDSASHRQVEDVELRYPSVLHQLDGDIVPIDDDLELRLVLPRRTIDLVEWSRLMHNCLNGWTQRCFDGSTWVLGFERDRRLTYVGHLTTGCRDLELRGVRNVEVDGSITAGIWCHLVDAGVFREPLRSSPPAGGRRQLRTFPRVEPF